MLTLSTPQPLRTQIYSKPPKLNIQKTDSDHPISLQSLQNKQNPPDAILPKTQISQYPKSINLKKQSEKKFQSLNTRQPTI